MSKNRKRRGAERDWRRQEKRGRSGGGDGKRGEERRMRWEERRAMCVQRADEGSARARAKRGVGGCWQRGESNVRVKRLGRW